MTQSQPTIINNSKRYLLKTLRWLIYFMASYYLYQFMVGSLDSSRSIFVEAKHTPTQEQDILSSLKESQFNPRILGELQEEDEEVPNRIEKNNFEDSLTSIAKLDGAEAIVVSKDGKRIFQYVQQPRSSWSYSADYMIIGMDITDPLAIKYYPDYWSSEGNEYCGKSLALSSDANTLFVVTCDDLRIYNVTDCTKSPRNLGYASFRLGFSMGEGKSLEGSLSVTLQEERNLIMIKTDQREEKIFNIENLKEPTEVWYPKLDLSSGLVVFLPKQREQRIALVGGREGLSVIDTSSLQDPVRIKTILKDEFVFSISLSADRSTAFVGVLNKTFAQNQTAEIHRWSASLSIYNIDLNPFPAVCSIYRRKF